MIKSLYKKYMKKCLSWGYKERDCKNPIRCLLKREVEKEIKDNVGVA